jgi:hypothetical protein
MIDPNERRHRGLTCSSCKGHFLFWGRQSENELLAAGWSLENDLWVCHVCTREKNAISDAPIDR